MQSTLTSLLSVLTQAPSVTPPIHPRLIICRPHQIETHHSACLYPPDLHASQTDSMLSQDLCGYQPFLCISFRYYESIACLWSSYVTHTNLDILYVTLEKYRQHTPISNTKYDWHGRASQRIKTLSIGKEKEYHYLILSKRMDWNAEKNM
jgi:hypothetical protein